ncbi:glycosyltransferase family 39 protein [Roseibium sp.]|uniref:glycosyltransferase family 39 protein n=1 Tax=Roseibium sp. TaxID=1936156 RepID=UPI003BAD1326
MLQTTAESRSMRIASTLLLVVVLAAAAALRLHDLDRTSLWYDEAVSWSQSNGSLAALLASVATDNYPPLHNMILWLTIPVIGDSETALRLPSAVLGVVAVLLTYLIGKLLAGRITGLTAATLLTLSPFHIWYSTEARMYALLAACGLAFLLATLKVLRNPSALWLTLLAVSGALFLYSHVYALLAFASVGTVCAFLTVCDLVSRRPVRRSNALRACLAMGVSTIAFLPWLYLLAIRASSVAEAGFWIAFPDIPFLTSMVFGITGSLVLFWLLICLAAFAAVPATLPGQAQAPPSPASARVLAICFAYTFGPALLAYLYSLFVQPVLFDRYLIASWPGLLLLAAAGAERLSPRFAPAALVAGALVLTFPELRFSLTQKVRPDWRGITQAYLSERSPNDRLTLFKGFAAPALDYYLRAPDSFAIADTPEDIARRSSPSETGNDWLLVVHTNPQELEAAKQAFDAREDEPVARTFGWGASGLSLFRNQTDKTRGAAPKKDN